MKKNLWAILCLTAIILLACMLTTGCEKKPKFDVTGKWKATVKYPAGKSFSPEWVFNADGTFHEFGGEPWGKYKVEGDQIKITKDDEKEYYKGTVTNKTHMGGNFVYVGFEDKETITWEAVKINE